MAEPELHLFVLWEKARFREKRILSDMARELEIVCVREQRFTDEPMLSYRRFYGPALPDARRKLRSCGAGPFLVVVVRDPAPAYGTCTVDGCEYRNVDVRLVKLKRRYRNWTHRRHRVHGTTTRGEFARDVLMLTGVGDVFPFMRVHTLLEALQPYFSDIPILVIYPGEFDGHYLTLFGKLKANDYYRAFNTIGGKQA